jgi:gamma-glutamylcyclotransferase
MIDDRGFANIVPSSGDYIHGFVYSINSKDEQSLDRYENVPIYYEKKIHPVEFIPCSGDGETEKRTISALVYIYSGTTSGIPAAEYVHRLNMAIKDALQEGIPQSYVDKYLRPLVPPE